MTACQQQLAARWSGLAVDCSQCRACSRSSVMPVADTDRQTWPAADVGQTLQLHCSASFAAELPSPL